MENALRGVLGFKGERGYSAYEIAVKNGFVGTEKDWLALLGTSSHFARNKYVYTATQGQTSIDLPETYTSSSFIDVYLNGFTLNKNEFSIDTTNKKIKLVNLVLNAGAVVEVVVLTMSTADLPIVNSISGGSTDNTIPSAKAVYNYVNPISASLDSTKTSLNNTNSNVVTLTDKVTALTTSTTQGLATKLDSANIKTLTGSIQGIGAGETKIVDIAYPSGFTKDNTILICKMSSSNNTYYDNISLEDTASGYPTISMVALTDSTIRVWMKNNSATEARIGYYKIAVMKVG